MRQRQGDRHAPNISPFDEMSKVPAVPNRAPNGPFSRTVRRGHEPADRYVAAVRAFSSTLNWTIRRIRSVGSGWPSGNCTEPFPLL